MIPITKFASKATDKNTVLKNLPDTALTIMQKIIRLKIRTYACLNLGIVSIGLYLTSIMILSSLYLTFLLKTTEISMTTKPTLSKQLPTIQCFQVDRDELLGSTRLTDCDDCSKEEYRNRLFVIHVVIAFDFKT